MEEWLRSTFLCGSKDIDNGDGTLSDSFSFWVERMQVDDVQSVLIKCSISWFLEKFGGVMAPPTATALKAVDPEDKMGWHVHFDEWVQQGIIQP